MSKMIPFGEWLPDMPPLGNKGATVATNVIADANSYLPFPSLVPYSSPLGSLCKGGIYAIDTASNTYNYAGDASALYRLVVTSFTAATRLVGGAYALGLDEYWEFAQWGNTVMAVSGYNNATQIITSGAANFADMSLPLKSKHITVLRDFVVMGNISDSAANAYRVRWSAINNPLDFTPDPATLSDYQDLPPEGGVIQRIHGGDVATVFQQRSIWRMLFVGAPLVFQFDRIHNAIGLLHPRASVRYQRFDFFLSAEGFYMFDGIELKPIGRGKVDRFFLSDFQIANAHRVHCALDTTHKLVLWAYPSNSSIGGNPDKLLAYSWAFDRWTLVTGINIELLLESISSGYTLESLDAISPSLDALTVSLDNEQWTGGQIILAAFDATHHLQRFNGSAMAATVTTGEFQLFKDKRAMLTEVRPYVEGLSAQAAIAVINRNNLTESASVGTADTYPNDTGFIPCRDNARYFRIRLTTDAGTNFVHLIGVDVTGTVEGVR